MNKSLIAATVSTLVTLCALSITQAQDVWNDGGGDQLWSTGSNWSNGIPPISTSAVQIGTQPTGDQIGIDTTGVIVASFTFNNTLTANTDVTTLTSAETLQVNGAVTNNSAFFGSFSLPVFAGASATWTGPLQFTNNVVFSTFQVSLANAITFSGTNVSFDITNASTYGRFLGAGTATVTGVTINIGGAYAGVANDTFDFTSGNFSGATLGTLPTLGGGLTWNTSSFLTNGTLTVVPEPATWALLTASLTTVMIFRRRRPKF